MTSNYTQAKRIDRLLAELGDQRGINEEQSRQLAELREAARSYLEMNNPVNSNKLEALLRESSNE